MKRLVGGDYQLDLSSIEIEKSVDGETYTSITDKSVLDQLTDLRSFIGKSGMIKPVWVKLLNGETDEIIVTRGSLSTSDGTTFLIKILLVGFILTLSVEFTQAETEDHQPLDEWYIDENDAKYILVSKDQELAQQLADFEGDVGIDGDLSVSGDLELGETSEAKIFENIVDADGNKRFIAGDLTKDSGLDEKARFEYAKWTLSGSHLMIVCMFEVLEAFTASGTTLASITIPEWLGAKIHPMGSTQHIAVIDSTYGYTPNNLAASASPIRTYLGKTNDTGLYIIIESGTTELGKYYRVVFDLVIN